MAIFNTGHIRQLTVRTNSIGDTFLDDNMGAGISNAAAPVVTNISATDHGTYFIVTWTTNIAATSQVDYGTTSSYGSSTTLDASLVTSHSVTLNLGSLSYNTLYHYRVKSGASVSSDQTTTTLAFPAGDLGALHIANGETVNVDPGTTWDYSSVAIDSGGLFHVNGGNDGSVVIIGCSGNFAHNGIIQYNESYEINTAYTSTAPDGHSLTYTAQAGQGDGSDTGYGGGAGGPGITGGVTNPPFIQDGGNGGDGYDNLNGEFGGGGGGAGNPHGRNGNDGDTANGSSDNYDDWYGSGGGGGQVGNSGGGILVIIKGNASGTGTFNLDGGAGGNGGHGGDAGNDVAHGDTFPFPQGGSYGGSGGGGGGGGGGGTAVVYVHGTVTETWIFSTSGGAGGSGGSKGLGLQGGFNVDGSDGGSGSPGTNGGAGVNGY